MSGPDRPAVTFALFAYNQENYVAEAISGALAQGGEPIEIILSDDCSTDRTHAIMKDMAAAYSGPHDVHVRREPINVGTVQHVINVARAARGELLVVAAGDDISYPARAGTLYKAWKDTGAAALASWHDEIDADGKWLRTDVSFPHSAVTQWLFAHETQAHRVDGEIATVPGFCAAYPRRFWADLQDPPTRLLVEDGLASAFIIFRGGTIHRVPQSLVGYRLLDSSLSNRRGGLSRQEVQAREAKIEWHARDALGQIDYIIAQAHRNGSAIHPRTLKAFTEGRKQNELIVGFWSSAALARLMRLGRIRSTIDAKYLLPRVFGFRTFAALRIGLEKWRLRSAPRLDERSREADSVKRGKHHA